MPANITRIALVDDHPIVIDGLKSLLTNNTSNFDIHTFNSAKALQVFIENNQVDIVLLDINLPDGNGVDLCANLMEKHPTTKIIGFSNLTEQSIIRKMFDNGACGYLLKSTSADRILASIQAALQGEIVMDQEVMRILSTSTQTNIYPALTTREKQLIKLLAQGKTTAIIAEELFLSKFTIDTYRKNLLQKFKVKNTSELLMLITKEKLL